ncbi:MAG TPA: ribose-5-phosphate isomerase RpiA, partial [Candidatus Angelobacter sp.]|nr:ribose-5-phosphate isomerase RpiA [Candidatus Angelobacter sp.]
MKRAAALRAVAEVEDGMVVGLGSGSTAAFALAGLAERVAAG